MASRDGRRGAPRSRPNGRAWSGGRRSSLGARPPIGGGLARTRTSWPTAGGARPRRCSATATGPAAATPLREAHAIADGLGRTPLRESIEALAARSRLDLAETGARGPAPAPVEPDGNPFGLTRRERDVLPLLVRGRTNRQIADELFISENTAGVHVSNILGKMGASTRTEAAGIAARLGLGIDP